MAATERISIRDLARAVIHDPWRKLVSLALAILLWLYLDAQVSASKQIELPLGLTHEAEGPDVGDGVKLFVQLDLRTYSVVRVEDATSGEALADDDVKIVMSGAKRLVELLDENRGYLVRVTPTTENGEIVASFGAQDIRPLDVRFEALSLQLDPARVRLVLEENAEAAVALRRERVDLVTGAPSASSIIERILWDDAEFDPPQVKLIGPASLVEQWKSPGVALYGIGAEAPAAGASRLRLALAPVPSFPHDLTLSPSTVTLSVPLRTDARDFRLQDVPVMLHEPERLRGRFRLRKDTVEIEIAATGSLAAKLGTMTPDERREWARDHAVVVARIPDDADGPDVITNPHLWIPEYVDGTHYRVTSPPPIYFELKSP